MFFGPALHDPEVSRRLSFWYKVLGVYQSPEECRLPTLLPSTHQIAGRLRILPHGCINITVQDFPEPCRSNYPSHYCRFRSIFPHAPHMRLRRTAYSDKRIRHFDRKALASNYPRGRRMNERVNAAGIVYKHVQFAEAVHPFLRPDRRCPQTW